MRPCYTILLTYLLLTLDVKDTIGNPEGLIISREPSRVSFFTVGEKYGYLCFIDPWGKPFFSTGICVTSPGGFASKKSDVSSYQEELSISGNSGQEWSRQTIERFREWNFNTLGAWSDVSLLGKSIPYTINLNLSPSNWQFGDIPDYWSEEFYDHVTRRVAEEVAPRRHDPMLIGYYFGNELRWGPDWRGPEDIFAAYFRFPADAPGKIVLVSWLRQRYAGDISKFRRVWNIPVNHFEDLLGVRKVSLFSWNSIARADRASFAGHVATQFFKICHDSIRATDPSHLLLGSRFVSWLTPREVVRAIAGYTDVVSVNHYQLRLPVSLSLEAIGAPMGWLNPKGLLKRFYEETGKPVLITEFYFRADDSGLPNTWPPRWLLPSVEDQDQRANLFEEFARAAFNSPHVIGWHWFAFMDEPAEGRFDGENSNVGLVSNANIPWSALVKRMKRVNREGLERRGGLEALQSSSPDR